MPIYWFAELGKAGDLLLGGENLDQQLVDWAIDRMIVKENLPDLRAIIAGMSADLQMRFWVDLKIAFERAKPMKNRCGYRPRSIAAVDRYDRQQLMFDRTFTIADIDSDR
jgi:hypothetical protein